MRPFRSVVSAAGVALGIAALGAACNPDGRGDAGARDADLSCQPLRIEPAEVRVASGQAVRLRAAGGSGGALFGLEGDADGATIEPGGGLRAGARAATFVAVARDALCGGEARATVEVLGAFDVQPAVTRVPVGGTVRYAASGAVGPVRYAVISAPSGAGAAGAVDDAGVFAAGALEGAYVLVARDAGSGRERRLMVDVGGGPGLRPAAAVVALPAGGRARLEWRGAAPGSLEVEPLAGATNGRVVREGDAMVFDAADARAGATEVRVRDRFTGETAAVRVLVSDALGTAPIARGSQGQAGQLAAGDVNGDGRADLVVGHAERSAAAPEAGGVLVYYGREGGAFGDEPDVVIEGERAGDGLGTTLAVQDVNADRIDDVVVGAPSRDLGEADAGAVAVYLGARAGLQSRPARLFAGEGGGHAYGAAVALGDLNGDGAPELVVGAPGAPASRMCGGGRAYVYRGRADIAGVFESIYWYAVELRGAADVDAPESPVLPCEAGATEAGRALALIDMDGDRALDLAVGAPARGGGAGAVLVYRNGGDGRLAAAPAWALQLEPARRAGAPRFGAALDVVREGAMAPAALVVRSAALAPGAGAAGAGGFYSFAPALPPPASPVMMEGREVPRVRNVSTADARAWFLGATAGRGVGRSAVVADLDGDGRNEYAVGAASATVPGAVMVFPAGDVATRAGALAAPAATLSFEGNELSGNALAALRGGAGEGAGLAVFSPWRTTPRGTFGGAVDYVPAAAGALEARWGARRAVALPVLGAGDRAGATVALGELEARGTMDLAYGAPGAHSPAEGARPAAATLRTGAVEIVPGAASAASAHLWVDRAQSGLGAAPVVALDFDGDGALELAVGDPGEGWPRAPSPATFANPADCPALRAGAPADVSARGVVRVFARAGGAWVERFRLTSASDTALAGRFGASLAAADTNGDGREDLVVGRPTGGAEVVLGRTYAGASGVMIACNRGDALAVPPPAMGAVRTVGVLVANLGDLDGDRCDDVALSVGTLSSSGGGQRAGVRIELGFDAGRARCGGASQPAGLTLVPDDEPLRDNRPGADQNNDDVDMRLATQMGGALPVGRGDVTGDGVPDVVFRDANLPFRFTQGPAVEIVSGAFLRGLCPGGLRACANTPTPREVSGAVLWVDGAARVLAVRRLGAPHRRVVPAPDPLSRRFGSALAIADASGDGAADLAIGAPDESVDAPFAGAVRVYRGGAGADQEALLGDPWLLALGDPRELGEFGAALALVRTASAGAHLAVGAPASSRRGLGGAVGAAYRWRLP